MPEKSKEWVEKQLEKLDILEEKHKLLHDEIIEIKKLLEDPSKKTKKEPIKETKDWFSELFKEDES